MGTQPGYRPVETVETALEIVDLLKRRDRVGVTTIADELGIAKSTASRHARTLEDRGILIRGTRRTVSERSF